MKRVATRSESVLSRRHQKVSHHLFMSCLSQPTALPAPPAHPRRCACTLLAVPAAHPLQSCKCALLLTRCSLAYPARVAPLALIRPHQRFAAPRPVFPRSHALSSPAPPHPLPRLHSSYHCPPAKLGRTARIRMPASRTAVLALTLPPCPPPRLPRARRSPTLQRWLSLAPPARPRLCACSRPPTLQRMHSLALVRASPPALLRSRCAGPHPFPTCLRFRTLAPPARPFPQALVPSTGAGGASRRIPRWTLLD